MKHARLSKGLIPRFETNYSVRISEEAIDTALQMASRYNRALHLPDKVIGWLDTAAVKVQIRNEQKTVRKEDVVAVIAEESEIPQDLVVRHVSDRFEDLEERLTRRVVGQTRSDSKACETPAPQQRAAQGEFLPA